MFGPVHILVNNAGNHLKKPAVETTDDEFAMVLQTHLFGAFALTRECARRMIERRRGAIVMIASMTSLFGIPSVSAYGAAKSAVAGLTRLLATEFSPHGVRINAVAPGWFDTALNRQAFAGDPVACRRSCPARRSGAWETPWTWVMLRSTSALAGGQVRDRRRPARGWRRQRGVLAGC